MKLLRTTPVGLFLTGAVESGAGALAALAPVDMRSFFF
jgi:hypothetical protein